MLRAAQAKALLLACPLIGFVWPITIECLGTTFHITRVQNAALVAAAAAALRAASSLDRGLLSCGLRTNCTWSHGDHW